MQNDELLPCPFCGGEAEEKNIHRIQNGGWGKSYFSCWCECKECHAEGKAFNTIDHTEPRTRARVFWNTRKPMERIVEQLEEELKLADKEKERCARENPLQFDNAKGYATGIYNAIEIVKAGGIDE